MIDVVDYDPRWPEYFEQLRSRYAEALAAVQVVAIEHVGSTAVEGLAAKPVIDIDIVVGAGHVQPATGALEAIGLLSLGEQGIPGRWAFDAPGHLPPTRTYVVEEGCLALHNHLAVRDALRADEGLRIEYERLKRKLAVTSRTPDDYVAGKSGLLLSVLSKAGFSPEDLSAIARANGCAYPSS